MQKWALEFCMFLKYVMQVQDLWIIMNSENKGLKINTFAHRFQNQDTYILKLLKTWESRSDCQGPNFKHETKESSKDYRSIIRTIFVTEL